MIVNMGVSKNRGTPKLMVYKGKPYYIMGVHWVYHQNLLLGGGNSNSFLCSPRKLGQ